MKFEVNKCILIGIQSECFDDKLHVPLSVGQISCQDSQCTRNSLADEVLCAFVLPPVLKTVPVARPTRGFNVCHLSFKVASGCTACPYDCTFVLSSSSKFCFCPIADSLLIVQWTQIGAPIPYYITFTF